MRKLVPRLAVGVILILITLAPLGPVTGEPLALPAECKELAFSTEEDFMGVDVAGASIVYSDGDLLGWFDDGEGNVSCVLCATNAQLVQVFQVGVDMGLDAADVIDVNVPLVAFSTELNSPNPGQFREGDLLATNGAIIPNAALTHDCWAAEEQRYDLGLDAVHFVGSVGGVQEVLAEVVRQGRQYWLDNPGALQELLGSKGIDILFSTEGTLGPVAAPRFLDGDLLKAQGCGPAFLNQDLLPLSVPAGVPMPPGRGVDFGLDAVTAERVGERLHFSTELLWKGDLSFTDGDVLHDGTGFIAHTNWDLIQCFRPEADFLGLDALHIGFEVAPTFDIYLPLILKDFQG